MFFNQGEETKVTEKSTPIPYKSKAPTESKKQVQRDQFFSAKPTQMSSQMMRP